MAVILRPQRTRQPSQFTALDLNHPAFNAAGAPTIAFNAAAGYASLCGQRLLVPVGTVTKLATAAGIVAQASSSSGNRVDVSNFSPPSGVFTVVAVFRSISTSNAQRLFHTSSGTVDVGIRCAVTTGSLFELSYGTGTATDSTSRRTWTATGFGAGTNHSVVAVVRSATVASVFRNGQGLTLTPSGTGVTYNPGTAGGTLLAANVNGLLASATGQSLAFLVIIPGAIPDALAQEISRNPWQLLAPQRRLWVPDAAAPVDATGTLAATLAGTTSATSGTVTDVGAFASTLAGATAAASGSVTATGTLSSTLAGVTAAASGAANDTGAVSATLAGATMAATGVVDTPPGDATGTIASTLAGATAAASGLITVPGLIASTLDGATVAATGVIPYTGALAATLSGASMSASGFSGEPPAVAAIFLRNPKTPRRVIRAP